HGFGYSTFYAHNKQVAVKTGQKVRRGDIISYLGSTGSSTGPHVHYEIWRNGKSTNPESYLEGRAS
ncbi:MAG: M23 family metallopeptidase, partial [Nitrospiraceae bacterium]|nr:M23 family metallopeptidase [Nitrospiraceae bacterium]